MASSKPMPAGFFKFHGGANFLLVWYGPKSPHKSLNPSLGAKPPACYPDQAVPGLGRRWRALSCCHPLALDQTRRGVHKRSFLPDKLSCKGDLLGWQLEDLSPGRDTFPLGETDCLHACHFYWNKWYYNWLHTCLIKISPCYHFCVYT